MTDTTLSQEPIPEGPYCYTRGEVVAPEGELPYMKTKLCPYWSIDKTKPKQENGHCYFLGVGDWEGDGYGMLWDQLKACGIKDDIDDDYDDITPWIEAMNGANNNG